MEVIDQNKPRPPGLYGHQQVCVVGDCTQITTHGSQRCQKHRTETCVDCKKTFIRRKMFVVNYPSRCTDCGHKRARSKNVHW